MILYNLRYHILKDNTVTNFGIDPVSKLAINAMTIALVTHSFMAAEVSRSALKGNPT